ncbi:MAG: anhydro-N-acetylmuramic acid kinase [Gammaproteobacteria bacterium]|nr:anhydro-N-acetylmuramic acid kinase [Gammaproteobacteria bacterium]
MSELYIGLMSGTSLDGVDAVLADFTTGKPVVLATHYTPFQAELRQALKRLCSGCEHELALYAELDVHLGRLFAAASTALLTESGIPAQRIRAIGSHGQTVRHYPDRAFATSLQIADPNLIAELTGIPVVADFRRRDIAAGGQGAPLVPAFHAAQFHQAGVSRAILNIGGIANLTILPASAQDPITGWDTGPGNTLLDGWILQHRGATHDEGGRWAATGTVVPELLERLLADDYFQRRPPKSTGPEHFHLAWLQRHLAGITRALDPADVQATLCELTTASIAQTVIDHAPGCTEVLVCGGGVHNHHLMDRLKARLLPRTIRSTASHGIDPDWVEALAFAWLARQHLAGRAGNLPAVTGARSAVILGTFCPAAGHRPA